MLLLIRSKDIPATSSGGSGAGMLPWDSLESSGHLNYVSSSSKNLSL